MRLFVALALPAETRDILAELREKLPGARWVARENLHLTLRFIGEVRGGDYDRVLEALAEVPGRPFELAVRSTGAFPPRGNPRVLFADVEAGPPLAALARRIDRALVDAGFPGEARKFTAHVTLARLEGAPSLAAGEWIARHHLLRGPPFTADRFGLYSSKTGNAGPVYQIEAEYPLERFNDSSP